MALRTGQPNFSKGELAEDLISRVDVAAYAAGLRRARNVVILKYGGVTKRPGTRLVTEVHDDGAPVRLVPFQFSINQTYALELGQGYMRVAANGAQVIEQKLDIVSIAKGATTTIEAAYHGYAPGDEIYFSGIEGMTELNGRKYPVVAGGDASHFVIDVDSTGFADFDGDTGGTTRLAPPPSVPTPPPPPPEAPPPPPPDTGGGGYGGAPGGGWCVADDTRILMADGTDKQARLLKVGDMVRTLHETTMAWGSYPITAIHFAWEPVWRAVIDGNEIRATAEHRFWIAGAWVKMKDLFGAPAGSAWVAKISVKDAQTYFSANILSHNIKPEPNPDSPPV
ncbi:MAG: Phage protein [Sphingomonas bacterium]|uniref:ubiquitin-activating E1 FCCH domain-containing protein n=1 Tax=Sphingomonas bacterium TaxID=1895847 RepID=UPI0026113051|nr:ubiquitin-activating E1 FCCH domain-containing protein [Sphingomonas bacterium]MDB5705742.1 Phage protein [Sphingomonas bacterium]